MSRRCPRLLVLRLLLAVVCTGASGLKRLRITERPVSARRSGSVDQLRARQQALGHRYCHRAPESHACSTVPFSLQGR